MSDKTTNNYKLMGFFELLTLIFVVAKITGYISWAWWWVFAPEIVHFAIGLVLLGIVIIVTIIQTWADS
ncbi:MAG: hypothetical protein WCX48_10595 [Bacteroidales bacterium]